MTAQMPPEELRNERVRDFKRIVENEVMQRFPELECTSWWRDVFANQKAGGDTFSQHLIGLAADFDWMGADLEYYKRVAAVALSAGLSAIVYWTSKKTYVHLQYLHSPIDTLPPVPIWRPSSGALYWDLFKLIWNRVRAEKPFAKVITDDGEYALEVR